MQVDGVGRIQVSKTVYNFTDMQDMRLVLGCKAHVDQKGNITPVSSQTHLMDLYGLPALLLRVLDFLPKGRDE